MIVDEMHGLDFFDDKWEQDRIRHFYFLDTVEYREITTLAKHCVVKGHRGTGKTTLLRAVHWKERLENEQLRSSLGDDPFSDGVVGCFLQIKFFPIRLLDRWLFRSHDDNAHTLISGYLRAAWVNEAATAIRSLNSSHSFADLAAETEALASVADAFWSWAPIEKLGLRAPQIDGVLTLANVVDVVSAVMRAIVDTATLNAFTPEQSIVDYRLSQFNGLVNQLFAAFSNFLRAWNPSRSWVFRVCMDEGEFLSPRWIRTIRTLIRESDAPLYLAISILEDLGSETFYEGTEISLDDRKTIDLDARTGPEFVRLINGIMASRITQRGIQARKFDIKALLGDVDFEDLVLLTIRSSEKNNDEVNRYRTLAQFSRNESKARGGAIYSYLLESQAIPEIRGDDPSFRKFESAGFRKKKTAGYLSLLWSLGYDRPRYAGWRVATAMADNSIRDFMRFLRHAVRSYYDGTGTMIGDNELTKFLGLSNLDPAVQDKALDRLGSAKMDSLPDRIADAGHATNLVNFLAEMTHHLDFSANSLNKPNPGRLVIHTGLKPVLSQSPARMQYAQLSAAITQCVRYGYLTEIERNTNDGTITLRVNRSLARYFGFSHWIPQYTTRVPSEQLMLAFNSTSNRRIGSIAEEAVQEALSPRRPIRRTRTSDYQSELPGFEVPND